MARRAGLVSELREEKKNLLLLDSGNLFSIHRNERDRLKAETLVRAYDMMRFDAVNLGERELTHGGEFLEKVKTEASFTLLSANVRRKGSEELFTAPYVIKKYGEIRVGIIGIVLDLDNPEKYGRQHVRRHIDDFETLDPEEALAKYLPELRPKVDFVILLSHIGLKNNKSLMKKYGKVDLVISSQGHTTFSSPLEDGKRILVHGSRRGSDLNLFDLEFDRKGKLASFKHEVRPLSEKVKEQGKMAALVQEYDADVKKIQRELMRNRQEHPPASRIYSGADSCKSCHNAAFQSWVTSPHAKAFDTLRKEGKDNDPECMRCHVTGYRERSGFGSDSNRINLEGVQCEACHGRGSVHVETQDKEYGRVFQFICRRCHNREWSPDFDYWKYLKREPHFLPE